MAAMMVPFALRLRAQGAIAITATGAAVMLLVETFNRVSEQGGRLGLGDVLLVVAALTFEYLAIELARRLK